MVDFRPILFINGVLALVLAAAQCIPALVDLWVDDLDWKVFANSAAVTAFMGSVLILGAKPAKRPDLSLRQAFLLTVTSWLFLALWGSLPFMFSALDLSITDAFFESMSGLTTTGATVITGLDNAPKGILLWRAILHWLGGIGIIVMAVAILPILKIGGMALFKMENSDKSDKVKPRTSQLAGDIALIYFLMTLLCAVLLWTAGMDVFDAVCHAMSALATGGFSTRDMSVGAWNSPQIEGILMVFMIIGGSSFVLMTTPWKSGRKRLYQDSQFRWFVGFISFFALILSLWVWATGSMGLLQSIRHASFTVVSIVTTTGFASMDYSSWGGFGWMVVFILSFIGGCTGSTSGGVKIFRWQVMFAMAEVHIKRLLYPNGVFVIDFNSMRVSDGVVKSVLGFVVVYFLTFALFTVALTIAGMDVISAITASAAALSSAGPGLGEVVGPAGSYRTVSDAAKWLLSFEMMLGRLELFSVIVLFARSFWRG